MNKTILCRCPTCGQYADRSQLIAAETEHLLAACEALEIEPDILGRVASSEAAVLIGCAPKTLADWRQNQTGPDYYRGRPAKYQLEALAEFLIYRRNTTGRFNT